MAMDSNIIEFPGAEPPIEGYSESQTDKLQGQAFRDLEGEVCDLERMGEIARRLIVECTAKDDDSLHQLGLATFAIWQLAKMLEEFKASYFKAYHQT
jgi:hypothetical protein